MNFKNQLLLTLFALIPLSTSAFSQDGHGDHDHDAPTSKPAAKASWVFEGAPYLLEVDVVTGKKLGPPKDQVVIDHDGRELRFSSKKSVEAFEAAPAPFLKKIDALMVADQLPLYPLTTCPVTGDKLGGMGDPIDIIYKNRLVRLCCKMCKKKLKNDPSKYIAELNAAAIKAQVKDYPLENCVVSGEKLGAEMGDIIDRVVGGRLVRLCCKMCIKKLEKDPAKFVGEIDAARAKEGKGDAMGEHEFWTCSMHPQIKLPDPGQCPLCKMDLIKGEASEEHKDEHGGHDH